ncbi:methyltransferase [Anaerocolumna sedimenticola]|uniref:Methyltransferase n=1 Tax=Anaerocolumna sedimenticola TaxID=2696063 RepID=A0A6P1TI12_9FIRM|nr:SAM-dependent methyltransferase [Anaerocolumna sedimenticola]QHQ60073.1 methyltransferase [Anaerocolumna sedimenticola]
MDQNILEIISNNLDINFIDMILSNPPANSEINKIKIRPVLLKDKFIFQVSEFKNKQVFHSNYTKGELLNRLSEWLENFMKQVLMRTQTKQITILISKKGKAAIKVKDFNKKDTIEELSPVLSHNREKVYILKEGRPVPFLIDLGVMTVEGNIIKSKYDKFKQINRFLEFVEDIIPHLDKTRELTIIDFGCGKSYLTFAMYYYLKELKGYPIKVIGLDLKKQVINDCNKLAYRYGYDKLTFIEGDIASYEGVDKVDMVVTLHACDTATDYALYKAVLWNADVILSVPCCQHELNSQIENDMLKPLFRYGLIKERIAALTTDALRAELLDIIGYKTQILEFIDMEHTPKNILIRAVKKQISKTNNPALEDKLNSYEDLRKFLGVQPTLYKLLSDHFIPRKQ